MDLGMMDGQRDGDGMFGWMIGWFGLVGLLVLALTVLAVVATVWLVRQLTSSLGGGREQQQDPVAQRYAAGEIDRETYLRMRDDLAQR